MRDTVDWIVQGSKVPLSIVIVGLGNDSFTNMVKLDADDEPLIDSHGRRMERDIVQFVPYRDVGNSPTRLAREVLDEIPREIVNFFVSRSIFPNPPQQVDVNELMRQYSMQNREQQGIAPAPPQGVPFPRQATGPMNPGAPLSGAPMMGLQRQGTYEVGVPMVPGQMDPYRAQQGGPGPSPFANMIGQHIVNQHIE